MVLVLRACAGVHVCPGVRRCACGACAGVHVFWRACAHRCARVRRAPACICSGAHVRVRARVCVRVRMRVRRRACARRGARVRARAFSSQSHPTDTVPCVPARCCRYSRRCLSPSIARSRAAAASGSTNEPMRWQEQPSTRMPEAEMTALLASAKCSSGPRDCSKMQRMLASAAELKDAQPGVLRHS